MYYEKAVVIRVGYKCRENKNSKSMKMAKFDDFDFFLTLANFVLVQILMFHFSVMISTSLAEGNQNYDRKMEHQNLHQNKICERQKNSKSSNFVIFDRFYFPDIIYEFFFVCIQPVVITCLQTI